MHSPLYYLTLALLWLPITAGLVLFVCGLRLRLRSHRRGHWRLKNSQRYSLRGL